MKRTCPHCDGTGMEGHYFNPDFLQTATDCSVCGGNGEVEIKTKEVLLNNSLHEFSKVRVMPRAARSHKKKE